MCFQEKYIFQVMNVFSWTIVSWAKMVEMFKSFFETKIYTVWEFVSEVKSIKSIGLHPSIFQTASSVTGMLKPAASQAISKGNTLGE